MGFEDVQSDLQALKKLYGLLQVKGNSPKNTGFEDLDEKARLLLKKLLDGATEQAFRSHSKIIAGQSGISSTPPKTTQPEDFKDMLKKQKASHAVVRNSDEENLNCHPITLQEDEHSEIKETPRAREHTRLKIAATEPKNRTKRSCVFEESSVKQFNSAEEKKTSNVNTKDFDNNLKKPTQKRIREIQNNASITGSPYDSSSSLAAAIRSQSGYNPFKEIGKKPEKTVDISEEIDSAMRRIEAHREKNVAWGLEKSRFTDANLLLSQTSKPDGKSFLSQRVSRKHLKYKDTSLLDQVLSQTCKLVLEGKDLPSQRTSQDGGKARDAITVTDAKLRRSYKSFLERGESPSQITSRSILPSQPHRIGPEIHGLLSQKVGKSKRSLLPGEMPNRNGKLVLERSESPSKLASQKARTHKFTQDRNDLPSQKDRRTNVTTIPDPMLRLTSEKKKEPIKKMGNSKLSDPMVRLTSEMQKREPIKKMGTSKLSMSTQHVGPYLVRPDRMLSRTRDVIRKKKDRSHQIILRPTLLDQKPNRAAVKASSSHKDLPDRVRYGFNNNAKILPRKKILPRQRKSEDLSTTTYSSSSWTSQQISSTGSSYSEEDSLPGRILTHHRVGPSSRYVSHRSSRRGHVDHEKRNFPRHMVTHHPDAGSLRRVGPTTTSGHSPWYKSEKKIGRLKRLKDKMGIIFHHYDHHHHHLDVGHEASPDHGSLWKHVQKIFHRTSKDGHRKLAARSAVTSGTRQHQHGHFHALVEGLLRHVWRTKKSKPSKRKIKRLGKSISVKKLHWWQKFGRRRGLRLTNKGRPRVKLGFKNRKPQLRGIKMN